MTDTTVVQITENPILIVPVDNTPSQITITDNTTAEVSVLEQVTEVNVFGESPSLTVIHGGTRGPIYAPGMDFGASEILAYLIAGIDQSHLNLVLNEQIDASTTGLADARIDLDQLIADTGALDGRVDQAETSLTQTDFEIAQLATRVTSVEGGDITALQSQISQTADDITLAAARLDTSENNISNAQIQIDAQGVQIIAIEGGFGATLTAQLELLANQYTLKLQEDPETGELYAIGMGAIIYPDWAPLTQYLIDEFIWFNGEVYKAKTDHMSSELNSPDLSPTDWQFVPLGVKSQIGFDAEQFYFRTQNDGEKRTLFVLQGDTAFLNGNLLATGSITASMMAANQLISWSVQSANYSAGTAGFLLDAINGIAEFNNMALHAATGTFSGNLVAAGGTFSGALSAATGTFAGTLSAATGSFSGSLSAASGTFAGTLSGANGTFAGSLTAKTVAAANVVAQTLTAAEIYGVARINGNRLGVVASGQAYVALNATVTITHNLGRQVIITHDAPKAITWTANTFSFHGFSGGEESPYTANYVYM